MDLKLSIVIPTYNNINFIDKFLSSLKKQTFPSKKMEIICVDGGSSDGTLEVEKQYKVKILKNPFIVAERGLNIGLSKATGDLIMILAVDNFFKDKRSIEMIVDIFRDKKIFAAFPKHDSQKNYSIFSKYHNEFTDPFTHFVYGYASNARTFHRIYKTLEHNGTYDVYDYSSNKDLPMIAFAQGFTFRSSYKKRGIDELDDCRQVVDLVRQNKKIAYVHSVTIYHDTIRDLDHFIRKQRWATQNALSKKPAGINHRLKYLSFKQKIKVKLWPFYAFSIIFPFLRSIYGFIKDWSLLWFFHPINCFLSAASSLYQVLIFHSTSKKEVSRH